MMSWLSAMLAAASAFTAVVPAAVAAQALPVKPYLPLDLARAAAEGAIARCRANGTAVTVYVLDRDGEPIVVLRDDDAKPHHPASARRKAYTALTFRMPSGELAALIERILARAA